jgi:hypothetical protein
MIIDALSRRSPSEAGELAVRDLREGSYLILEKLKNTAAEVSPIRRKRREQLAQDEPSNRRSRGKSARAP